MSSPGPGPQPSAAGAAPAPRDVEYVRRVAAADHNWAIVATARRDGSIQASVVTAGVMDHPVTGRTTVAYVARGETVKLRNMRRDPRTTVVFRAGREWVTVEGRVSLIGPDDAYQGFDPARVPQLLREVFTAAGGTHDNWVEYDRVMAAERRTAVFVEMDRVYSNATQRR